MTYLETFQKGNLVLPSRLLFRFHDLFDSSDDFIVWQFFFLQNTTKLDDLAPSQIAEALGKRLTDVNQSISRLTNQGLLETKTIELSGEIEVIFDASPALAKLDKLDEEALNEHTEQAQATSNVFKSLVDDFQGELGRFLTPFELEDLEKTIEEDHTDPEIVRLALKEATLNGKFNMKYINAILRNWRQEKLTSARQVKERLSNRDGDKVTPKKDVSGAFFSAMDTWSTDGM
ncbi:DnaD domain-containing protein [Streptococcus sp. zg-JUN1979]|uniref:DnaD domain-containing protein n=1 Tax=Streptococcus sp. zg-JUN1979 TaxID=3391450 RepID=UPI0039A77981